MTPAVQSSLYRYIDFDKITTYNEAAPGSGRAIIKKAWDQRLDTTTILESDGDEQLLIYVPSVDLLSIAAVPLKDTDSQSTSCSAVLPAM